MITNRNKQHLEKGLLVPDQSLADMASLDRMQVEALARKLDKKVRELEEQRDALLASERKYRKLHESMMDGFVYAGMDGKILDCNETYRSMLGYDVEELKQMTFQDITPEKWHAFERNMQEQVLDRGHSDIYEKEYRKKDGTVFPVELHTFLIRNEKGEHEGIWAIVRDLTERKKTEELLRKSEDLNRNILDSIGEGLIVIDRDYRVISVNRAYCEQQRTTPQNSLGKHCYQCSHHIDKPCFEVGQECAPKKTFETGRPHASLHVHQGGYGNLLHVEIRSFPIKDASGAVTAVIEILQDVTERKKLEDQLRHSQKMEAVGQLAGGVAHDFNNILTAILGYSSLLLMKLQPGDPLRYNVEQILQSTTRASNLTQSLLAFGRKQVLHPKPIDLNETVRQVERFLHRLIGEDITFDIKVSPEAVWVKADYGQIGQVLMNLATNARDAMPNGGLLDIETGRVELDEKFAAEHGCGNSGSYALLSVSDTGAGMDEMTKKKIFEPFFTTKEVGKGTGLGLAIVYGIIKQHEGFINVHSEPGKGTTFKIFLPLIPASVETAPPQEIAALPGGTETVLLAEDDDATRNLTALVLEDAGYRVIAAKDGEEVIEKYLENKDRIKLVILDVIMPMKNAGEVYGEIKKLAPETKMLFTSGYTAETVHKQGILEEGVNFLSKPASPTALLKKVREVLDA